MATATRALIAAITMAILAGCKAPTREALVAMTSDDLKRHVSYDFYPYGSRQQAREILVQRLGQTWPAEYKSAVLAAEVCKGMTPDMVATAWGTPDRETVQYIGRGAARYWVWDYGQSGYAEVQFYDDVAVYVTTISYRRP